MLYECLAGRRPFEGENDFQLVQNIVQGKRAHLRDVCNSDTPDALVEAVEKLLESDVDKRMASANALLQALRNISPLATTRMDLAELVRPVMKPNASQTS